MPKRKGNEALVGGKRTRKTVCQPCFGNVISAIMGAKGDGRAVAVSPIPAIERIFGLRAVRVAGAAVFSEPKGDGTFGLAIWSERVIHHRVFEAMDMGEGDRACAI